MGKYRNAVVVGQSLSHVQLFVIPWKAACQSLLSSTISQNLLKSISIESGMLSNHLILCHPLLLLPPVFPSIRVFSNELALCIRWPKYWSFTFSISPSSEYSGLISFKIDWFDPMDYSLPALARILEWVDISSSRGSSWPRDLSCISCVSCIAGGFCTTEPSGKPR